MEFKDRVPTYPNRRKITYEDGTSEYATVEFADEPIEPGTPLNRNTLLNLAVTVGTYTGNKVQSGNKQFINLGFTPASVLVVRTRHIQDLSYSTLIPLTSYLAINGQESDCVQIVENGFWVGEGYYSNFNENGVVYNYICTRSVE